MVKKPKRPMLIKMPEVLRLVTAELDINVTTAKRMIQEGHLPAPAIHANRKSRWWRRADIEAFLEGRQAACTF